MNLCSKIFNLGGERRVIELLENKLRKQLDKPLLEETDENQGEERRSYINFFFRPFVLGKDLLIIEKFGLVQYVSHYLSSVRFDYDLVE